jgi:tetratricopeptide (TPR) repeat protein
VINPFIRLVTERAAGLPLYVKYVIGDVLGGKYRVLDGEEELPDSLHSYHEELLRRLGVGDLQAVVTPLAAILATAYEPLSVRELVAILVHRKLLTEQGARQMVEKGLAAIASMVRSAPDPEGEVGYCLFHQSLRDHMTGSDQMTHSIAIAREAFADIAEKTEPPPELRNYLLRCGIDHLLEVNRKEEAERLLLDLDHLYAINQQGVKEITIYRYWEMLGGEIQAMRYIGIIEKLFLKSSDEDMMEKADLVSNIARKSLWLRLSIPVEEKIILKHKEIHGHVNLEITDAYENLAESYQLKGNFDRSIEFLEKSIDIRININGSRHKNIATSYNNLGLCYANKSSNNIAIEYYKKALKIFLQSGKRNSNVATIYNNLGLSYGSMGLNVEAIEYFKKSIAIDTDIHGPEFPKIAFNNLGSTFREMGDFPKAICYIEKSLKSHIHLYGKNHLSLVHPYYNLAKCFEEKREFKQALELHQKCLAIEIKNLGSEHIDLASTYHNIGETHIEEGEYQQALDSYQKCLAIEIKNLGSEHIDLASTLHNIGETHIEKGEYQQALDSYQKCLAIEIKNLGSEHIDLASTFHNIGEIYIEKGEYQQAIDSYQKCLAIEIKNLGSEHIDLASTHEKISNTYSFINDFERSMEHSEKTLKIRLEKLGHNHPDVATALNDLGLNWTKAKNFEEAVKYLSKAVEICMNEVGSFSFENALILGNYGHALGMCGEIEKGVSFSHRALKCKLEQETLSYSSIQKSYQKLTEIFEHAGNEDRAQENEAMAKWSELRSEGRFLDEIDSVEFEKEVGISHEWARQIEEDIINSK